LNTFRHSGKLGDIIYSLPTVRALGGGTFYVDYLTQYREKPPLGLPAAQMMVELLETQDCIHRAALFDGEPVVYDLDRFRAKAVPAHAFNAIRADFDNIAGFLFGGLIREIRRQIVPRMTVDLPQFHWESAGLPGQVNLSIPWITGISPKPTADIVVCKTARHGGTLAWSDLKKCARHAVFVGLEEEWQSFRRTYFDLDFYKVNSLVEFAQVVAGAKLYVGNQSFGLALADAMLIPRVAELWEQSPNRMPALNAHQVLTPDIMEAYISL
jgi:hypothetical protein